MLEEIDEHSLQICKFTEQVNSTYLLANKSEAVVQLPKSVAKELHRISFIVFRNGRAYQDTPLVSVNSRIVSIKVKNVTKFNHGEVSIMI